MKFIFFILLIASLCKAESVSQTRSHSKPQKTNSRSVSSTSSREELTEKFAAYVRQTSDTVEGNVEQDAQDFAKLRLNSATDFVLLQNVLLTVVKLDKEDPSRTALMLLSPSYHIYKKLYHRAFQTIRNESNAEVVKDLEEVLESFSENGNG